MLQNVTANFAENDLPLDVIWTDIDYMVNYQDFTINETWYNLTEFKTLLNKSGLRYVPIIDAGVAIGNNTASLEGKKRNVFIKSAITNDDLVGTVWPGPVNYVDFFHPNSTEYWSDMLNILYKKIPLSGIWLDMNEVSNFCDGECPESLTERWKNMTDDQRDAEEKKLEESRPYSPISLTTRETLH
jgi:alpha-glucosidase (family GH31 glycosyl hydrolase)